jgi:TROVE domain/von Willebrand factor type A domain
MSKLNTKTISKPAAVSPLTASAVPGVKTYGGGKGAVSNSKTELFRLGVNLFYGGEDTFYEKGKNRDDRFTSLVEANAIDDPIWTVNFLVWLRNTANIRTASVVGAAHFVHARLNNKKAKEEDELLSSVGHKGMNRYVISEVLSRADEPGEFIAYWISKWGDKLPKPVKRGIADSVLKLYNEYTVLKYDTASHAIRFSNVLNMAHPKPDKPWRAELFKYVIDKRYENKDTSYALTMINENTALRAEAQKNPKVLLDMDRVKAAGLTWEDSLSMAGSKVDKAKLWEAVIPSMGIFALVRNLRNFEQAGISKESRDYVISQLSNADVIAKSRMFPFRFLSAFNEVGSLHYQAALETALELSTQNIPVFDEGTLVLIDTSGSMSATISNNSKMTRAGAGALFGAAIAAKNPGTVDLVMFGTNSKQLIVKPGTSVLNIVREVDRRNNEVGSGTETAKALEKHFSPKKHKRVLIFTDGQSFGRSYGLWGYYGGSNVADFNFHDAYVYAFDLAGYKVTDLPVGKDRKYQLGGLSDATFKLIPMLEQGEGSWPWNAR